MENILDIFNNDVVSNVGKGVVKHDSIGDMKVFDNADFGEVRVIVDDGEPLFCAMDVCRALGYNNGRDALHKHVSEDDVAKRDTLTNGGNQQLSYINESGLYSLIFGSKLESARRFKDWVTHEVLPSIRKTGGYQAQQSQFPSVPTTFADALRLAYEQQLEIERQKAEITKGTRLITAQTAKIASDAPKVDYYDAVLQAESTYTFTQMAKELDFRSEKIFTKALLLAGIVFRQSDGYMLKAGYSGMGYSKTRTFVRMDANGKQHTHSYMVWTETGREFLHFLKDKGKI